MSQSGSDNDDETIFDRQVEFLELFAGLDPMNRECFHAIPKPRSTPGSPRGPGSTRPTSPKS